MSQPKVEISEVLSSDDGNTLLTGKAKGRDFSASAQDSGCPLAKAIACLGYGDKHIFVRADKDAPYGNVMDRLREAGMTRGDLAAVFSGLDQNSESSSAGP